MLFTLLCNLFVKNFTTTPVKMAAITVPSLVPTRVKLKKIRESIMARVTQLISKIIFILPKFLCVVSAMAFTKASPGLLLKQVLPHRYQQE